MGIASSIRNTNMTSGLLEAACILFAFTTAVLIRREWRRHKRHHPKHPIPAVSLVELEDRFNWDSPQRARNGVVYFTSNANNRLPATPSDLETYVLAALAKDAHHMFEFGTCTGRTTYLWGLNSPEEARITTLTLGPEVDSMKLGDDMRRADIEHALSESTFATFVYSGTPVATKVEQLFQDSATLDTTSYRQKMDLIFIDGGHCYAYVKNDSLKALEMVAPGGKII